MSTSFPAHTSSPSTRPGGAGRGPSRSRPTLVVGVAAGAGAALLGVAVCAVIGLVGWYLSDAGGHGEPRQGLLMGARGWLVAHGAGLSVDGTAVTMLPLGLTAALAWVAWQAGLRLGEAVWDHGPDEYARLDGSRDLTVPLAVSGFVLGYVALALVTSSVATGSDWAPGTGAVLGWALGLAVLLGGVGVVVGSGRAEHWAWSVPLPVQDAVHGAGALLRVWLGVSLLLFVVAMVLGADEALDTVRSLGTSNGETFLLVLACLLVLPQAVLFASAFLLGPGFAVGTGTAVAPGGVVLGPLPLLPVLGALPDEGTTASFWVLHPALPVLLAVLVVARRHARLEVVGWNASLTAGAGAGLGAALVLAFLTSLADGAIGPGRMSEVGADPVAVLLAAVLPFVGGGVCGAALGTWWARRGWVPEEREQALLDGVEETWDEEAPGAVGGAEDGAAQSGATKDAVAAAHGESAVVAGAVVVRGTAPGSERPQETSPDTPEETIELVLGGGTDPEPATDDRQVEQEAAGEPAEGEPADAAATDADAVDADAVDADAVDGNVKDGEQVAEAPAEDRPAADQPVDPHEESGDGADEVRA